MTLSSQFQQGKLLRDFSTLGIGGPARYFIEVKESEEMRELIAYCFQEGLDYLIIGKGSNCLFDDRGFDGLVILNKIAFCTFFEGGVFVGSGYSFSLLGSQTARKGLSGLEFASGIPATVGGAIYMNAGANGAETSHSLLEVMYISEKGESETLSKSQMEFGYRFSSFQKKRGAIVAAKFQLLPSDESRQKQLEIIDYRTRTQPYGDKSIGCFFRNPSSCSAGALIEKCGLKGARIGGAEVSTLHANFLINKEGATASDLLALARLVQETVQEKMGISLEMEVRCIPFEGASHGKE